MKSIQARVEARADLVARDEYFLIASPEGNQTDRFAFSAAVPHDFSKPLRLSQERDAGTWLEMSAVGTRPGVKGTIEQGTVVYRGTERDVDVVLSFGGSRLESLNVLHSASAPNTSRYSLTVAPGMQLRELGGRIEALDASGRVAFRTNAAFAVDAAGTTRSVELRLAGNQVTTSFNADGLKYPVVVDPEWVFGPTWPHEVVAAQNSFDLAAGATIVGDVAVIQPASGGTVGGLAAGQLDLGAQFTGSLTADSIRAQSGSVVTGDAHFNTLSGPGLIRGERFPTLALPVAVSVPNFPAFTVGTQDVTTNYSGPLQLAAGSYRSLNLQAGTTVRLTGGVYAFSSIAFGSGSRFECLAACDVRLSGRFVEASGSFFGPATGAGIGPDSVEVFVSSTNGSSSLSAIPAVVLASGTIAGRFFAPNGTISVSGGVQVVGTLVGRDVLLSAGTGLVKDVQSVPTCTANDNNPCTQDTCNAAGQPVFTPLPLGTSCADANLCNGTETCNGVGACSPGAAPVIDDGNPCTTDSCDATAGVKHQPVALGTACSDGNLCNGSETCNSMGVCGAGSAPTLDDGNPCTADACDPSQGVTHTPVTVGTSCADSNACNGSETCNTSGVCSSGTPPSLDDGNPCTTDSCDPTLGVRHTPVTTGTSCADGNACNGAETCSSGTCGAGTPPMTDDGNPCTVDTCDPVLGVTHLAAPPGSSCSDGNACNGSETCNGAGLCNAGAPPPIDDGNPCTADACDPATGVTHVAVNEGSPCSDGNACNGSETCSQGACTAGTAPVIDDGNPCTADSCDAKLGVRHTPVTPGTACSDGNACNGAETCNGTGTCAAGVAPVVDDGNPCTVDACSATAGVTHTPAALGTSCDDADLCNGHETCNAIGFCGAGSPLVVDDGNLCTTDSCNATSGVHHVPAVLGTSCSDGNACNGAEQCDGSGVCAAGTSPVADDGNPCTADSCDPAGGVKHTPLVQGTSCSDGNACNGNETCNGSGVCAAGTPVVIDDHNPCTADACDAVAGVTHAPATQGTSCADANLCNGDELCDGAGSCRPGTPLVIDDGNPCTADSCTATGGVAHTPVSIGTSCSDSNLCNGAEKCDASGSCAPGTPLAVDDGNPCTVDSCDPTGGVAHVAAVNGTSCADGNACNGVETCQQGSCSPGTAPVVDDSNPCTADSCDPGSGVVHSPVATGTSCSNNNVCDGAEACDGAGHCASGVAPAVDDGNPCTVDACDPTGGVSHIPAAPGLSCSDGNVCNGAERCDAMGACTPGASLVLDDGDPCTADTCDPTSGAAHTVIVGCAGGTPGQEFETRASIMGRVINGDGSAVTVFTVKVFNDTLDSPARADVTTTINPGGTFRTRLTQFPQSVVENSPPQHILVRIESDAFPSLLRSAYLLPGDVVALGDLMVLQRDPNVTMIGPEGGTAQDSQGTLQLQIPPGALSSATPVRLTPIPTRAQFPAPLPNNTVTMYGMEIEPSGTVLALPATLRVKNTLNLPTTMKIPVGTIDARYGDWTHEGFATWDGTRFSTTVSHFSPHDCNGPRLGELVGMVSDGSDRNKAQGKDCGVGSATRYANGTLEQGFDVPLQSAAGHDYSLTLNYSSELSGSVSVGQGPSQPPPSLAMLRSFATPNTRLQCQVQTGSTASCPGSGGGGAPPCILGGRTPLGIASYTLNQHIRLFDSDVAQSPLLPANTEDLEQPYFVPLSMDENGNPARSGYVPVRLTSNVSIGGSGTCVGSGAGFDVSANFGSTPPVRLPVGTGDLLDFPEYHLVVHRRGSPMGSGWSFNELATLYRTPDGASADIVHGDGQQETFHPYPVVRKVVDLQNSSDNSLAVDTQTGDVFAARGDVGVRRMDIATGTFTAVASGNLFGGRTPTDFKVTYVAGARRFLAATTIGIFEVTSDGVSRQIATFPVSAGRVPAVAGLGKFAYFVLDQNGSTPVDAVTLQRIDLTDPARATTLLSPASGGDLRLDPHGETEAQGFQFYHPVGLAPAFDGGLYVSDNRRHAVYHLAPNAAGEVGADSIVTRTLGSGVDTMIEGIGRTMPALETGIRAPGQLAVAPDGTLYVITSADVGGLLAYDPNAQTAHWIGFDSSANLAGTDSAALFRLKFRAGSIAPLAKNNVLVPFGGVVLQMTTPLASQYQPLRTLSFGDSGATVVDAGANVVEQYTWSNQTKTEAPLTAEALRSGEAVRSIAYKDADRVDYIQDAAGGRVTFAYDGGGHLSSLTDPAQRVTQFTVDSDGNLREVIYPSGEARRFEYQDFRMTSSTHPNGEVSTYSYSADGTLQTAQRPGGGTTTVQSAFSRGPKYDSRGQIYYESLITDDRGVQRAVATNAAGAVVSDKYSADGVAYDVENVYATLLNGAAFYDDAANRLLKFSNTTINGLPSGPFTAFDTLGRAVKVTQSPTDNTLKLAATFDATQRLSRLDFGVTAIDWGYTYDDAGHLTKVADLFQTSETGRRTTYGSFRAQDGQPTTTTSHGIATTLTYDAHGLISSATDALGRSMTETHDDAGNVTTTSDGATTVSYGHDQAGRVTSITDAENNTTTLSYETAGCSCSNGDRVTSITTPDLAFGQKWAFSYNADGDLQTSITPLGETETYAHNAQRDVVAVTDRAGRSTGFTYDHLGRQATISDPAGRVGVFNYAVPTATSWAGATIYAQSPNAIPAPVTLTGALADGQYQVGVNGTRPGGDRSHVALYRDATFQTSQWVATDALDRVSTRQDRSASGFSFDSTAPGAGNLGTTHPPFVDEFYDDGNFGSPWELPFTELTNDSQGNQFWSTNFGHSPDFDLTTTNSGFLGIIPPQTLGTGGLIFSRDTAGRLTGVTLGNASSALATSVIGYQPNGKVSSVAIQTPVLTERQDGPTCHGGDPDPDHNIPPSICSFGTCDAGPYPALGHCAAYHLETNFLGEGFQYDDRGLVGTRLMPQGTAQYSYDSVGRNTTLVYPDGHQRTQVFDAVGRLISRCYLYNDGSAQHCYTATYDAVGNPTTLTDPVMRQEISYDDLDRVVQVQRFVPPSTTVPAYTEDYAYNALGGFSVYDGMVVDDQRPRLNGGGKASAGIPATYGGLPVALDAGGRVTSFKGQTFQYYNFHHRLETYSSSSEKQTLAYDGLERVASSHFDPPTDLLSISDQIFTYSDAGQSISAIVNSPHTGNLPPKPPDSLDTAVNVGYDGIDHPLWLATHDLSKKYTYFYTELDCVGNVRHLHSEATADHPGDLGGYSYSAFGKSLGLGDPGGVAEPSGWQPFRWQGKRLLSPSQRNLYDSRARVWSADLGAFLQPDEYVFLSRTGTLWSWPGQNPFRWRDPSGRDAEGWFLRNADTLSNGALTLSAAAITIATGGLAGELLGLGTLEGTLGASSAALTGAARAAASGAGAAATAGLAAVRSCGADPKIEATEIRAADLLKELNRLAATSGDPRSASQTLSEFFRANGLVDRASMLPQNISATPGISADLLLSYRAVAEEVIANNLDKSGLQAARIDLIDSALNSGAVQ